MYLLVNILEQAEHLGSILEGFANIGIKGSTVLNSTGMGRVLMKLRADMPAMQEISKVLTNLESPNKTIMTVIENKENLEKAIKIVKTFCGDLCEPGKGILFALPLEIVEGMPETN